MHFLHAAVISDIEIKGEREGSLYQATDESLGWLSGFPVAIW